MQCRQVLLAKFRPWCAN